jgi:hypothetical protein
MPCVHASVVSAHCCRPDANGPLPHPHQVVHQHQPQPAGDGAELMLTVREEGGILQAAVTLLQQDRVKQGRGAWAGGGEVSGAGRGANFSMRQGCRSSNTCVMAV